MLLVWTDGKRKIPVAMRLWQKGGKSKVELAREMITEAADRGLCPKYVLFDSWYTSKSILNLLDELGWKYVGRIKSNRLAEAVKGKPKPALYLHIHLDCPQMRVGQKAAHMPFSLFVRPLLEESFQRLRAAHLAAPPA